MNAFNLDEAEVVELKNNELEEVDGGLVPAVAIACFVAGGLGLVFLAGVAEGMLESYNAHH